MNDQPQKTSVDIATPTLVIGNKPATQNDINLLVVAVAKATEVIKKQKATIEHLKKSRTSKSKKHLKPKQVWEEHETNKELLVCKKKGLIRIKKNGIVLSASTDEETLKKYL